MDRLKRWLSMKAYKHAKLYLFAFIVMFNIVAVLIGGVLLHVISPEDYDSVLSGIWQIFTDILDPGFLSTYAGQEGNQYTCLVEIFVILICMTTFTGAIIGYISNMITTILDNSEMGPKQMYLKDHIVILNWNDRAAGIISEYLYTEICEDVVVLTLEDREQVTKEITDSLLALGFDKKQKHVNFAVKQGEPYSCSELDSVCIRTARTVIILNDTNPQDGDLKTLKTVMMVSQMNLKRKDCTIIVETNNQNIYELVNRIQNKEDNNIIPAYLNKLLGKLLAHVVLQPELNIVFAELFSHSGKEFYSISASEVMDAKGRKEKEILTNYFARNQKAIPVITSMSFAKDDSDKLFVLAKKHGEIDKLGLENKERKIVPLQISSQYPIPRKNIIIFGSNSKMKYMINSFLAYAGNYGEETLSIHFVDTPNKLAQVPEKPFFHTIAIKDRYNVLEIRKVLKEFDLTTLDTIVLLSDDTVSAAEYDSGALISLIDLNKEIETIDKKNRPEVIVEILNPQNHEIVQQYNIDNIIVSNKYISSLVAQLGDDDSIYELIYDILTFDRELDDFEQVYSNNNESRELYVKECGKYFEKLPTFDSYHSLIESVYYASGKKDVVIGVIYAEDNKNYDKKHNRTYLFPDSLDREQKIELCAEDKLIVFANRW